MHDVPRFLTSRSASTCPLVVAVSPAATRRIVVPSTADITGQNLELGNWELLDNDIRPGILKTLPAFFVKAAAFSSTKFWSKKISKRKKVQGS